MLDPQAKALLDLIAQRGLPAMHTLTPVDARAFYRDRRALTQPLAPDVAEVRELVGRRARPGRFRCACTGPGRARHERRRPLPVLVYCHGGGWTIGDLDTHDVLCRQLANGSGCALVSVDYRMGPEHRFPAAVDDCLAATYWVAAHAAVASASMHGAWPSAATAPAATSRPRSSPSTARDAGDLPIAWQLLDLPGDRHARPCTHRTSRTGKDYLLTNETIALLPRPLHRRPGRRRGLARFTACCTRTSAGLPPALVLTAGFDPLRDEGPRLMPMRSSSAGNRATYVCFERQIHGFITMGKVIGEANSAVALCAAELARMLGTGALGAHGRSGSISSPRTTA